MQFITKTTATSGLFRALRGRVVLAALATLTMVAAFAASSAIAPAANASAPNVTGTWVNTTHRTLLSDLEISREIHCGPGGCSSGVWVSGHWSGQPAGPALASISRSHGRWIFTASLPFDPQVVPVPIKFYKRNGRLFVTVTTGLFSKGSILTDVFVPGTLQ